MDGNEIWRNIWKQFMNRNDLEAHYLVKTPALLLKSMCMLLLLLMVSSESLARSDLVSKIENIKPGIVSIGIFTPLESDAPTILGSGFAIGDGKHVATNYHVVSKVLDPSIVQYFVTMSGEGRTVKVHRIEIVDIDPVHDLAILSIKDTLPSLPLAPNDYIPNGSDIFMTGFPIGAVLGLYPATHTGIIAALTPDINPARNADDLTIQMLKRLKEPFMIYQLDITAFPGNSGSPVLDRESAKVVAVLNKVFVSQGKEAALTNPSGISYAIPIKHLKALAKRNNIAL